MYCKHFYVYRIYVCLLQTMIAGDAAIYISILILLSIACLFTITGIIMLLCTSDFLGLEPGSDPGSDLDSIGLVNLDPTGKEKLPTEK
jgi:hypothetical protein